MRPSVEIVEGRWVYHNIKPTQNNIEINKNIYCLLGLLFYGLGVGAVGYFLYIFYSSR